MFTIGFIVFFLSFPFVFLHVLCILALSLFLLSYCFLQQVMHSLSSSASTVPSFDDYFAHNMWNPLLECFSSKLDSTIRAVLLHDVLSPNLGFTSAGVAPLPPCYRKLVDEKHVVRTI